MPTITVSKSEFIAKLDWFRRRRSDKKMPKCSIDVFLDMARISYGPFESGVPCTSKGHWRGKAIFEGGILRMAAKGQLSGGDTIDIRYDGGRIYVDTFSLAY